MTKKVVTKSCQSCLQLLSEVNYLEEKNRQLEDRVRLLEQEYARTDQRRRHAVATVSELQQDKSTLEDRVWVLQEQLKNKRAHNG